MRLSIAALMAVVVYLAAGIAALVNPSVLWAGTWLAMALVILTVTLLGALFSRGNRRVFCQGFAIVGWGFLALNLVPGLDSSVGARLPTSLLMDQLYRRLKYTPKASGERVWVVFMDEPTGGVVDSIDPNGTTLSIDSLKGNGIIARSSDMKPFAPAIYYCLGNAILCPVVAVVGGMIAKRFAARNDSQS